MNKLKLALMLLFALPAWKSAFAQQELQLSQYMLNTFQYNPAAAGIEDYTEVKANYRKYYTGIPGANNSFFLTGHGALNQKDLNKEDLGALPMRGASTIRFKTDAPRKIRHGAGANYTFDRAGLYIRNQLSVGYAIHLPVSRQYYLSFGANVGGLMTSFDNSGVSEIRNPNDPTLMNGGMTISPDVRLGALLYSDRFYVGLSSGQLLQNRIDINGANTDANKLNVHYYLTAGYRLALDDEFDLIPSALIKYATPTVTADAGIKVRYRQSFWAGGAVRVANAGQNTAPDAVYGLVGFTLDNRFDIGYSYDFTTSALSNASSGSHEIMLGLRLFNTRNARPKLW